MSTPAGTGPGHGAGGDRIAAGPISWGVWGDAGVGEVRGHGPADDVRRSVEFLAALLRENVGIVSATEGRADRPNA